MQVNCFCSITLSEMTFCTRPFTASNESRSTAFSKEGMPWTTFQHWQVGLLLQWQEDGLARGIKMETTKRKHRKVELFQCITSENNAFVFSLVFTSQGQVFILHCSSLALYFSLHPILQVSSPPTAIKSSGKNSG